MFRKSALIIGNNDYQTNPLKNCENDATSLADILRSVGCEVDLQINLKSEDMYERTKFFTKTIQPNDFIIFFFAGHAVQWGDQNFLLPCDNQRISSGRDMERFAINAQQNVDEMAEMKPHFILFLLDCCRDYWLPTATRSIRVNQQSHGLNRMIAPPGTLIAFACAPGQIALDQLSGATNGIFTKYLLKHIITPDLDIEMVLRKVARDVMVETNHAQIPYRVSCVSTDNVYLLPIESLATDPTDVPRPTNLGIATINMQLTVIRRTVIDSSGIAGSLYDMNRDCVLTQSGVICEKQTLPVNEPIRWEIINSDSDKPPNILKMIGIDDDLRLNILLNPTLRNGVAALVDHSYPIDKFTRFVYFFYIDLEQRLSDDPIEIDKLMTIYSSAANATHIITAVSFGIDVVVVLQLPRENDIAKHIDCVLQKTLTHSLNSEGFRTFTTDEENLLEKITKTRAYSNVSELTEMSSFLQIYRYINEYKKLDTYYPLAYTFVPIERFYPDTRESYVSYIPLEKRDSDQLEENLTQILDTLNRVKHSIHCDLIPLHSEHLQDQLNAILKQWKSIIKDCEDENQRLRSLLFGIHIGKNERSDITKALQEEEHLRLENNIRNMRQQVDDFIAKGQFIIDLQKEHFDYYNVAQQNVDDEEILKYNLINDDQYDLTLCCSDALRRNYPEKCESLHDQLFNKLKKNPELRLRYADFSYCSFELRDIIVLSAAKKNKREQLTSSDNDINILLLGESGVEKSIFINAFANYLKYETFEQAETNTLIEIIPISFIMLIGDYFEEYEVKFGDNVDHQQQSIIQRCKSYIIHVDHNNGNETRIIDTPDFGDTRNIQHILEYINKLTHLNAICFLLKPNASQINNFLPLCLTQLLNSLGPNAPENILFCFTNTRSTLYTPGDTASLLKDILKSLPRDKIPFNKENTFCFDNESFRYLVALQRSVVFDDHYKKQYEMSWSTSVNESKRLYDYICDNLSACYMRNVLESIRRVQLSIIQMIRPMLEAMRNILRNLILQKTDSSNKSIELHCKPIHQPTGFCFLCKRHPYLLGNFWILPDYPHVYQNQCLTCSCKSDQHISVDYLLSYDVSNNSSNYQPIEMSDMLDQLCFASAKFAYFLVAVARSTNEDPFHVGLIRISYEEKQICAEKDSNHLNLQLVNELETLIAKYQEQMKKIQSTNQNYWNSEIFDELIKTISEYPIVREQLAATRQAREIYA